MENIDKSDIAIKNKKAYANDVARIISGAILSLLLVLTVLIFRRSAVFGSSKFSPLDFTLLFLLLSGSLFFNGIKALGNHRKMPDIMLRNDGNVFYVLGDEVPCDKIKSLKGKHEFGRTGTIIITTDLTTYNLYGVKNYAEAIKATSGIIAKNR